MKNGFENGLVYEDRLVYGNGLVGGKEDFVVGIVITPEKGECDVMQFRGLVHERNQLNSENLQLQLENKKLKEKIRKLSIDLLSEKTKLITRLLQIEEALSENEEEGVSS